ncbi:proteinase inhibitor I3 [Artemisia annua]|uniref:Proteinase inhibitor I3 n=1 Tax=Artemisia annua TaxID=35608 RepID=A0A2U1NLC2_ARTAN|nr:proteinase inhibitor I3 [Artemisia annua]
MKLFILAFILFALSANSAPSPVLDAYGKNLRAGVEYYVMPAAGRGESGLLRAAVGGNDTCPAGVAQFRADHCNESNIWRLKYEEAMQQYFVKVGGVQGNPGRETLDNWFKVEKTEDGYKFVDDHGNRRLALSDVPFSVHFYRVTSI